MVENHAGKVARVPPRLRPRQEAGNGLGEAVEGVTVDVGEALQGRVDPAVRAIVARADLLLSGGGVLLHLGDGESLDKDIWPSRVSRGKGEVHLAETLRDLLPHRHPQEEVVRPLVAAQLVLHSAAVGRLLGVEVLKGNRCLSGVRLAGEGLVVGHNAGHLRPIADRIEDLEGFAEPDVGRASHDQWCRPPSR